MSEAHPSPSPIDVLVADDDPDCRRLVRDALAAVDRRIVLHEVADGAEALRFLLSAEGGYATGNSITVSGGYGI